LVIDTFCVLISVINVAMKAQSKFPDSLLELRTASTTTLCH